MKNLISSALIFCIGFNVFSQSLENRIPASAECVISLNGKLLSDKIGVKKIQKSEAFIDFISGIIFRGNESHKISNIGIDLEKDLYFFFNEDSLMEYFGYLYEIEKPKLFEKYMREKDGLGETITKDKYKVLFYENERDFLAWNEEFAIYVTIDRLGDGLREEVSHDYEWLEQAVEAPAEEVTEEAVEVSEESEEEYKARMDAIEAEKQKKEAERKQRLYKAMNDVLTPYFEEPGKGIMENKAYTNGRDHKADVSFWIGINQSKSAYDYLDYYWYDRGYFRMTTAYMEQYFGESLHANAYFNKKDIKINADVQYNDEFASYFKEIYASQLPKEYLNYINTENVLALSSVSVVSEKIWEHYPKMYARIYENLFNGDDEYTEEIEVLLDFVSIMLDEKALGDLVTGNGIFVLKDLSEVEVEYTSYEYNEDYTERNEVTKTKKEVFPEFIGMFGTRNKPFMEKLLGLAVKHEVMYRENQYYYTTGENRDFPFEMGFTIQNDIAFVSSDLNEIKSIIANNVQGNVGRELEAGMMKNQSYVFFNIQELLNQIPTSEARGKDLELLNYARENTRSVEMVSNMKGSKLNSEIQLQIPEKSKNGALYVWDFISALYEIERN